MPMIAVLPVVKGSPYLITEHRFLELISVLGSQPAGDMSHKPGVSLPLLSDRPAVTLTTLLEGCYQFRCLVNKGTMGVNSLPKTVNWHCYGCDLNPGPFCIRVQHANHLATESPRCTVVPVVASAKSRQPLPPAFFHSSSANSAQPTRQSADVDNTPRAAQRVAPPRPSPKPRVCCFQCFGIAWSTVCLSVCLSVPCHSCLGYRHAGCLQLSHRQPPEICGLWTRPRMDVDPPQFLPPSNAISGGVSSRSPRGDNLFLQL